MTRGPDLIVLLCGKRKCGKDFIATLLQNHTNYKCDLVHLSEPIKEHFSKVYNYDKETLMSDSSLKERIRREMIAWGEEQRQQKGTDVFCRQVTEDKIKSTQYQPNSDQGKPNWIWIVVDCRRRTDLHYFYNNFKCKMICVKVMSLLQHRIERGLEYDVLVDDAQSECGLDYYQEYDFILENNCTHFTSGTLDELPSCECCFGSRLLDLSHFIDDVCKI